MEKEELPSKVVFLDIDGVLNNDETDIYNLSTIIHEDLLQILKRILTKSGAVLVLSSNWRYYEYTRQRVNSFLKSVGIQEPISCTPRLDTNRLNEIICWLQYNSDFTQDGLDQIVIEPRVSRRSDHLREASYRLSKVMHVSCWIAIDDIDLSKEGNNTAHVINRFVHVDKKIGLTDRDADLAIALLNQ